MNKNEIINSQKLKEETEKEFGTKIIESNSGSTRYSSRDKSYSNLIDFFIKVARRDPDRGATEWQGLSTQEKSVAVVKAICALIIMIGFIGILSHFGGKLGLIISLFIVFAVWMIVYRIGKKRNNKEDGESLSE